MATVPSHSTPLGGSDAGTGDLNGLLHRRSQGLEEGLCDVVGIFSIKALHMQSEAAVHCKGPQKLFGEAGIISPDHRLRHISVKDQEGPVRKVQNREAQGLVHWDTGGGEAAEPLPIPQGPVQSLAKDDARVLHRVVAVYLQISLGLYFQPQSAVKSEGCEHVVKKSRRPY